MHLLPSKTNSPIFAITAGDSDGVGLEVTVKALLKKSFNCQFVIFISPNCEQKYKSKLFKKFSPVLVQKESHLVSTLQNRHFLLKNEIVIFDAGLSPQENVLFASQLCNKGTLDGLITAPMSKSPMVLGKKKQTAGHTEILKAITQNKNLFMTFIGSEFSVLLATDHIGLRQVPKEINKVLHKALEVAALQAIDLDLNTIGVLGLNPHAGERGLIGQAEDKKITLITNKISKKYSRLNFLYPLSPDAAFMPHMRKKIDLYVALYHDQGLIPFKALHGFNSGVHITSGLNFIRTSVDHGTAKDIFGQNKALEQPMIDAITYALKLHKNRRTTYV